MATLTRTPRSAPEHIPQTLRNSAAIVVGIFLVMHGIAHSLAFFTQWQLMHPKGLTYATNFFFGKIEVGDVGIRIDGLLWLAAGAGFVIRGVRLAWLRHLDLRPLVAVTLFSLALCVLGLSQAIVGVWIDVAILAAVAIVSILSQRRASQEVNPWQS